MPHAIETTLNKYYVVQARDTTHAKERVEAEYLTEGDSIKSISKVK